jgi:hypothetical protein
MKPNNGVSVSQALPSKWAEARAWKKQSSSSSPVEGIRRGRKLNIIILILWGQFMIQNAEKNMYSIRIQSEMKWKSGEKVTWFFVLRSIIMIWFLVLHSIMMILWSDLKSEMKRLCVVCNECYEMHVLIASQHLWLFLSLVGSDLDRWGWCDYIESVLKLGRCWSLSSLLSRPRHHMFAGHRVRWALLQNFTSLSL